MTERTLSTSEMPRISGLDPAALTQRLARGHVSVPEHTASAMVQMLEQTDWTRSGVMTAADTLTWWLRADHPGRELSKDLVLEAISAAAGMENWDRLGAMLPVRPSTPEPVEESGEMTQNLTITRGQRAALMEGLAAVMDIYRADYGRLIAVYGSPDQPKPADRSTPRLSAEQRHANVGQVVQHLALLGGMVRKSMLGQTSEFPQLQRLEHLARVHARLERTRASSRASASLSMTVAERDALIEAADHYSRILMGQPYGVTDTLRFSRLPARDVFENMEAVMDRVHQMLTGLPANASAGIGNPGISDTARVLYDIQQVLRLQAAEDRNMDSWTTWRRTPMRFSENEKLPVLTVSTPVQTPTPRLG